jgi:hypothetical protein
MLPQLPSENRSFSLHAKFLLLLAFLVGVTSTFLVLKDRNQPRFEGQTMHWWFDQFVGDRNDFTGQKVEIPSHRQLRSVHAFRQFGKQGFDFLANEAGFNKDAFSIFSKITSLLNQIPWTRKIDYFQTPNRKSAARSLLFELKFPYEWIQEYLPPQSGAQTGIKITPAVTLLGNVTTQQSKIIQALAPGLNTYQFPILTIIDSLYDTHEAVPEMENHLQSLSVPAYHLPLQMRILSKHATHPGFARNKLNELATSQDLKTRVLALAALGAHETTSREAKSRLSELLPDIPLNAFHKTPSSIILSDIFSELGLWQSASEDIRRLAVEILIKRLGHPRSWSLTNEQAFLWIVGLAPESAEVWNLFDRINQNSSPTEIAYNLRMVAGITVKSNEAIERLIQYANSDYKPHRTAAENALDFHRLKGLTPDQQAIRTKQKHP